MPPVIEDIVWVRVLSFGRSNPSLERTKQTPIQKLREIAEENAKYLGGIERTVYTFVADRASEYFHYEEEFLDPDDRYPEVVMSVGLTTRDYTEMCLSYTVNV